MSADSPEERDINDIFDDLIALEDNAEQSAYDAAFDQARIEGNTEGYHLGYHRGAELGAELGYYSGFLEAFAARPSSGDETRLQGSFRALREAIATLPPTNDDQVDIFERIDRVRALFRRMCAQLKTSGRYPEADTLTF